VALLAFSRLAFVVALVWLAVQLPKTQVDNKGPELSAV